MIQKEGSYEHVLTSIGDGVVVVDKNLRVVEINDTALQFFHKRKSSVVGTPYWRFVHVRNERGKPTVDSIRKTLREQLRKTKDRKKIQPKVLPKVFVRIPKGGVVPISANIAIIYTPTGAVNGAVLSFRDIEEEVEVSRMKSEFVSLAAHQLRAPLTSIRWNIEFLLSGGSGAVSGDQTQILQDIYESNLRMIRLINDLLNVSRLEDGRVRVEPTPIVLDELIAQAIKEQEPHARARGIAIQFQRESGLKSGLKVSVDQLLVFQALRNYLSNAIKYSDPKNPQVKLTLSKDRFHYRVSVWDNGIGIPAKSQKKIFSKFYRAENATEVDVMGSGLGLYIVKKLIELSGGRVGFTATVKEGTTFYFTIPIKGSPVNRRGKRFSELS